MTSLWSGIAASLLLSAQLLFGEANSRIGASPSYEWISSICPKRCIVTSPNSSNWSTYHDMNRLGKCDQTMLYGFNPYNDVDDPSTHHQIFACTAYGNDWNENSNTHALLDRPTTKHSVISEIGWSSFSSGTESDYRSLMKQMRDYISRGNVSPGKTAMLYAQFGGTSAGIYIGNSLQSKDTSKVGLQSLIDDSHDFDGRRDTLAMQLCGPN